jgi:cellulose biosynthesis protein BcsQ
MKVVTVGSFKGGTGKTTLCAALGTAFAVRGLKTRIIELDTTTKPLARFQAAREFADLTYADVKDVLGSGGTPDVQDWQILLRTEAENAARKGWDMLVIDTGSVWRPEVIAAHLCADLVITTVTESPIDLYQLMPTNGPSMQATRPYEQLINLVHRHAEKLHKPEFKWMMCLNRRSHLRTRIGDSVRDRLKQFSDTASVSLLDGLVDRVGYRNMMETGITPMDDIAGEPVQRSLMAARTETNRIASRVISSLGVSAKEGMQLSPLVAAE